MSVGRSVDDHGDCAFFDGVGDMRAALLNLVNHFRRNPPRLEIGCGAASGDDLKARPMKSLGDSIHTLFVFVPNADENFTLVGQTHAAAQLGFGEGQAERPVDPHHLAGGFHFRAQ